MRAFNAEQRLLNSEHVRKGDDMTCIEDRVSSRPSEHTEWMTGNYDLSN